MEGRVSANNVFASVTAHSLLGGTLRYQDASVEVVHDGTDPGSLTLGSGTAEFTRKATLVDHGQTVRFAKGTVTVRLEDKVDNTSGSLKSDVIRINFSGVYTDQQGGACTWSTTLTNMPNGWVSPICHVVS